MPELPASPDLTRLLIEWEHGSQEALDQLMPLVYDELRVIARRHLSHEAGGHTLQSTALVHEAYLKLVRQRDVRWQNRAHFFGIAAQLMRRILVDHARRRNRLKRGGLQTRLSVEEVMSPEQTVDVDLLRLDDALAALAGLDPRQARIVELRFFGGLTIDETAKVLNSSSGTVKREWSSARAWLFRELHRRESGSTGE